MKKKEILVSCPFFLDGGYSEKDPVDKRYTEFQPVGKAQAIGFPRESGMSWGPFPLTGKFDRCESSGSRFSPRTVETDRGSFCKRCLLGFPNIGPGMERKFSGGKMGCRLHRTLSHPKKGELNGPHHYY